MELPHEAAAMNVYESLSMNGEDADLSAQKKLLLPAKDLYNKKKDYAVDARACEDQIKLLDIQNSLDQVCCLKYEKKTNSSFFNHSHEKLFFTREIFFQNFIHSLNVYCCYFCV